MVSRIRERDEQLGYELGDVEPLDDRVRQARELMQRANYWHSADQVSFIERYITGKLEIGFRRALGEQPQYGFVLHGYPSGSDHSEMVLNAPYAEDAQLLRVNHSRNQLSVLPHSVELMERPKRRVAAFIRFQLFKDATFALGEALYEFSPTIFSGEESGLGLDDREINLVRPRYAVAIRQRCGEHIKRASDGVQIHADFDIEGARERFFRDGGDNIVRGITLRLFDRECEVIVEPSVAPLLQGWESGFGPLDASLGV